MARAVFTAGLAGVASLAMALPAQAHGTRQVTCNGTIGAVTVGSVVIADATACVLDGTTVKGEITVGVGAALDMSDVTAYRSVTSTSSGRVTAVDSTVYGSVSSTGTGIVRLTGSGVAGDVTVQGESTSFSASDVSVAGDIRGTTVSRFDVADSFVGGALAATEAFSGSNLCGNWVSGATKVTASGGAVLLGGATSCAGNTVRGSVVVENNAAYIAIAGNTIRRDLSCTGNDPAPEVGTNTVRGTKSGQCV